jgi:hypothetical protein
VAGGENRVDAASGENLDNVTHRPPAAPGDRISTVGLLMWQRHSASRGLCCALQAPPSADGGADTVGPVY